MTRVALLQLASPTAEALPDRLARVERLLADASEADVVMLPELWPAGFFAFDAYAAVAEPLDGPLVRRFAGWAREHGVLLQPGSFVERHSDGTLTNTALVIDADGRLLHAYRKVHLFGHRSREAELLTPGDEIAPAETSLGMTGLTTCYDLRFPELYRVLVDRGAQVFAVCAAWPAERIEHWRLLTRARAVENQAWLIACNAAGDQAGVRLGGHSVVVAPDGTVAAEAGPGEQVLLAEIDPAEAVRARAAFPWLADRRITEGAAA